MSLSKLKVRNRIVRRIVDGRMRQRFTTETWSGITKAINDSALCADGNNFYYLFRSVYWADKLAVPILILHSRVDRLAPVDQALRMAAALQASGKVYALHIYERDAHSLPLNREDRNRQIVEWFSKVP